MVKRLIIFMIVISTINVGYTQKAMSKVFDGKTKIVFLGLDFTQARFIGNDGFNDPYKLKSYYFTNLNALLEEEYGKYNLPLNALKAKHYMTNTSDLMLLNDDIEDIDDRIINGSYYLKQKEVEKAVKKYKLSEKKGIGISFVVESFNHSIGKSVIWVTFINLNNGNFLYAERMVGNAEGFGFRNYWAGSIHHIIEQIRTSRYKIWKRKF